MIQLIAMQMLMYVVGMGMQVAFYALSAYWVARMAHKGWRDGK